LYAHSPSLIKMNFDMKELISDTVIHANFTISSAMNPKNRPYLKLTFHSVEHVCAYTTSDLHYKKSLKL